MQFDMIYMLSAFVFILSTIYLFMKLRFVQNEHRSMVNQYGILQSEHSGLKHRLQEQSTEMQDLKVERARLMAQCDQYEKSLSELKDDEQRWMQQFENIASRVMYRQGKALHDVQVKDMNSILNPLKDKIKEFESRVEHSNLDAAKRHEALKTEIRMLTEKSEKVSQDANNLARALKGDFKKQGHWGELILESILDKSGLEKNREYFIQESGRNANGKTIRPDVVIKLPDNKVMVIDSKVSLSAYSGFVNSHDLEEQKVLIKQHVTAIKNHVDTLSSKRYHDLYNIESPDFVLMFVPIDTAFSVALQAEDGLYNYAFDKDVVIVTSSTLLATLKTVESMWRNDKQNRYALTIAEEAGKMYDKFVGFYEDMKKLGNQVQSVQNTYNETMKKLNDGSGNLVRRSQKIKELGAKASKALKVG